MRELNKICRLEGCQNLGEFNIEINGKIYRRSLCSKHRRLTKNTIDGRYCYAREKFKRENCKLCEYCQWEGPCDVHRPNKGRYEVGNMRSCCPNCHRLITRELKEDKFYVRNS